MFLIQLVRFAVRSVLPMVLVMWALLELLAFLLAVLGGILSVMAAFHYLGRPAGCAWIAALVLGLLLRNSIGRRRLLAGM